MFFKKDKKIAVEVSARHCHLSKADMEALFGVGYELKKIKDLSQPSDFACEETIEIEFGPPAGGKKFPKVRVVGPLREKTQVEVSLTDAAGSGVVVPLRLSGDLDASGAVVLRGPAGQVGISEGLIIAKRHLHCSLAEAKEIKVKNGDVISVKIDGERPVVFGNVIVRVKDGYKLSMQIDTDEGNASGINKIGEGIIVKQ